MHKQMMFFGFICFCIASIFIALNGARAEEFSLSQKNENDVIRYRHWYVPHNKPELWSLEGQTLYAPILKSEFQSLLKCCDPNENCDVNSHQDWVSSAIYYAKLDGNDLVDGSATLKITTRETLPREIPIEPLGMWFQGKTLSIDNESYEGKLLQKSSNGGSFLAIPEELTMRDCFGKSLKLEGNWSLHGERISPYRIRFAINFPQSITSEIIIRLPNEWTPHVPKGSVIFAGSDSGSDSVATYQLWRIVLGNRSQTELTLIRNIDEIADSWQRISATQTTLWNLTSQGLETTSRVVLERQNQEIRDVTIECENNLRLTSITCNGHSVETIPLSQSSQSSQISACWRVMIPADLVSENFTLDINAQSPLVRDCSWTLPRIILDSPSILVREQHGNVIVEQPLLLKHISVAHGIQSSISELLPERAPCELLSFQFFNRRAAINVQLGEQTPTIFWHSGTQIVWNAFEVIASMTLDVTAHDDSVYVLEFPLQKKWDVESVQQDKKSETVLWNIRDESDTMRVLEIILPKPLKPNDPALRFIVKARCSSETEISLENLLPIPPSFCLGSEHVVAVLAGESSRLQWDQLLVSQPQLLTASSPITERRFALSPDGFLFPFVRLTAPLVLEWHQATLEIHAQIDGNVVVRKQEVEETYAFRCRPTESVVDAVKIRFDFEAQETGSPNANWIWHLRDEDEVLKAQNIAASEWLIEFAIPRSAAFELVASRKVPLVDGMSVPLPSVINASQQQAKLSIESQDLTYFRFETRLESLAPPPTTFEEFSRVRALLSYNPSQELNDSEPAVRLYKAADILPAAWVWRQRLHSQFESGGVVRNNVTFRLENRGLPSFTLTFPAHLTQSNIRGVWIDEQQIAWSPQVVTEASGKLEVIVPLPENRRFVTVAVEYFFQDEPLARKRKLEPMVPRANIPVLNDQWIAWIPPEYMVSHKTARFGEGIFSLDLFLMPTSTGNLQPFDPFQVFSLKFWQPQEVQTQQIKQVVEGWLTRWGEAIQLSKEIPNTTWGEILRNVTSGSISDKIRYELLIDRSSLALWDVMPTTLVAELNEVMAQTESRLSKSTSENAEEETLASWQVFPFVSVTGWFSAGGNTAPTSSFARLSPQRDSSMIDRIKRLLDASGLALLVAPQGSAEQVTYKFYLTTFLNVALHRDDLVPLLGENMWLVSEQSPSIISRLQWIPANLWTNDTSPVRVAWGANIQEREFVAVTPTWNAYASIDGVPTRAVYVVPQDTIVAWGWFLFFAVLILTQTRPLSHPIALLMIIVCAEGSVRNITICYAPLPAGILLGGLCSFAFALIRIGIVPNVLRINPRSLFARPIEDHKFVMVSAILVIIVILMSSFAHAEWSEKKFPPMIKDPYRVLIPVDDSMREIGDTVWVSTNFHSELMRHRGQIRQQETNWSLVELTYTGTLEKTGVSLSIQPIQAVYSIRTTGTTAIIRLPLSSFAPREMFWDDIPIEPVWLRQHDALEFQIDNTCAGLHTLKMKIFPETKTQGDERQVRIAIPAVPNATFKLTYPSAIAPPRINQMKGSMVTAAANGTPLSSSSESIERTEQITAYLGASSFINFSWTEKNSKTDQAIVDAEQFFWMWCRPRQVNVRAQFLFYIKSGTVQQLSLLNDPRFQISGEYHCYHILPDAERLPKAGDDLSEYPKLKITSVESKSITLEHSAYSSETILSFSEPVSGTILVNADFFLRSFGGIGQVHLPRFSAVAGNIFKSLLMTSADPSLQISIASEDENSSIENSVFLNYWNQFNRLPQNPDSPHRAFSLKTAQTQWLASIETKPLVVTANNLIEFFAFDGHHVEVFVEANLQASRAQFMQTLILPEAMEIDRIDILDSEGRRVDFRRITADARHVNLFFKHPITQSYTLRVRGAVPKTPCSEAESLPRIEFANVQIIPQTTSASISIYRTPNVQVCVKPLAWKEDHTKEIEPAFSLPDLIFVGRYTPIASDVKSSILNDAMFSAAPRYSLEPNNLKINGTILESINRVSSDQTWNAKFDFALTIERGELGVLPIALDENCIGKIEVEPKSIRIENDIVSQGKRRFFLVLDDAIRKNLEFSLTVQLQIHEARVVIPTIQIDRDILKMVENSSLGNSAAQRGCDIVEGEASSPTRLGYMSAEIQRFVAVPIEEKIPAITNSLSWEMRGMKESVEHSEWIKSGYRLFEVIGDDAGGTLPLQGIAGTIRLWDIRFFVRNDGEFFGFASGDVEGGAGREVILKLPAATSFVEVSVAGITVPLSKNQQNNIAVRLGGYPMPQQLEIVYRGKIARNHLNDARAIIHHMPFPQIEGIAVQETLWSIAWEAASDHISQLPQMEVLTSGVESETNKWRSGFASREAVSLQATLALIRLNSMMAALESVTKDSTSDIANLRRWFGAHELFWDEQISFLDRLLKDFPNLKVAESLIKQNDNPILKMLFLDSSKLSDVREVLTTRFINWKTQISPDANTETSLVGTPRIRRWTPQASIEGWANWYRDDVVFFVGIDSGKLENVGLKIPQMPQHTWKNFSQVMLVWIGLIIFCVAHSWSRRVRELIAIMPHFWFIWFGLILWMLTPPGGLGLALVVLALATFFTPLWRRRAHHLIPHHT